MPVKNKQEYAVKLLCCAFIPINNVFFKKKLIVYSKTDEYRLYTEFQIFPSHLHQKADIRKMTNNS